MSLAMSKMQVKRLIKQAHTAGMKAGNAAAPTPMIVGTPTELFGNDIDPTKKTYYVSEGVCGFAWVNVKPANGKTAKELVAQDMARKDSYYGGVTVWVHQFNQSMVRKEAYARAFANVLETAGVRAYAQSRMD